jgi:aspartate/methionine/tyrosine aminotransferase
MTPTENHMIVRPYATQDDTRLLALLREAGVLCVHGSGFGTPPDQGFFRVVFLASPAELGQIYDTMAQFTREYLARG